MRGRDTWVLVATIVGSSLAFIDGAVVSLALPEIQREFRAGAGDVAWIMELYTLVLGSLMLLGGALADRNGRKRIFLSGIILFTLGSIGCAFAWSIPSMLVARVVQALGGTLVAPASLALIGAHFIGDARAKAIAAWSAFGALTATLGPMLGGVLIDGLGWRSVFWINVPLAALVIYATLRHIDESRDENAPKELDYAGAILCTAGLGGVTYGLIEASNPGRHAAGIVWPIVAGIALFAFFVWRERHAASPLIPPDIFASGEFGALNLATFFLYGALGGLFYMLPFAMIQAHGFTALQTALATLPMMICLVLLARVGTRLAKHIGLRTVLTVGPAIVASGFVLLALFESRNGYVVAFLPGILGVGVGMGITVAPLTTGVIDSADPRHVGIASGINTAVARIAGLIAIAVMIVVLSILFNKSLDRSLDALQATTEQRDAVARQRDRLGGAHYIDQRLQRATIVAFDAGFRGVALTCAACAAIAALIIRFSPVPTARRSEK
jgi:EmrB/QacA subfamily drug resistance transporter